MRKKKTLDNINGLFFDSKKNEILHAQSQLNKYIILMILSGLYVI